MLLNRWLGLLLSLVLLALVVACRGVSAEPSTVATPKEAQASPFPTSAETLALPPTHLPLPTETFTPLPTPSPLPTETLEPLAPAIDVTLKPEIPIFSARRPTTLVLPMRPTFEPASQQVAIPGHSLSATTSITSLLQANRVVRTIPTLNRQDNTIDELPRGTSSFTTTYIITNTSENRDRGVYRLRLTVAKLRPLTLQGHAVFGVSTQRDAEVYESYQPGPALGPGQSWPFARTIEVPSCGVYEQTLRFEFFDNAFESRDYVLIPGPADSNCDLNPVTAYVPLQP